MTAAYRTTWVNPPSGKVVVKADDLEVGMVIHADWSILDPWTITELENVMFSDGTRQVGIRAKPVEVEHYRATTEFRLTVEPAHEFYRSDNES